MSDTQAVRHARPDALGNLFLNTAISARAFRRIDDLLERGWEPNSCRALLLLGPNRAGKTHIVMNWLAQRVRTDADGTETPHVVSVEVPAGCSLKLFAEDLLTALGDPAPEFGSQAEKTRRIAEAVSRQRVDLIIIDEVQRLIDANTDRVKRDVANWLTALLNRRVCPLLLVGEETASRVFDGNEHLQGRTLGQLLIGPYAWGDEERRAEFRVFLNSLDEHLGLPEPSRLGAPDTALRIHAFSGGLLGKAALLVDQARRIAQDASRPRITHDILAEAVDELRIGRAQQAPNPFRMHDVQPEVVAHAPPTAEQERRR